MLLSYRILFSVQLLHEYFNKDVFSDCSLIPSDETAEFFNGSSILQKFLSNSLFVMLKDDGSGKPYSPVNTERIFRFYLKNSNPNLFNYSNLDSNLGKGQLLYFSNLANNNPATDLNLSAPIASYDATVFYSVGDFAKDPGGDNIFECIQKGMGNDPLAPNTTFWVPRNTARFVSSTDLAVQSPASFRYSFSSSVKKYTATVKGFKVSGVSLVEYDAFTIEQFFPNPVTEIMINLSVLPFGRYKIALQGTTVTDAMLNDSKTIYYDANTSRQGIIGVIEIFNFLPPANAYSMVDGAGIIKEIKYTIHFANRNAIWKYITETTVADTNHVTNIGTGVVGLTFSHDIDFHVFTSNKPIQLKQIPDNSFVLEFSNSSPPDPVKASFPSPSLIKCEKDIDGSIKNFFTEIHINY